MWSFLRLGPSCNSCVTKSYLQIVSPSPGKSLKIIERGNRGEKWKQGVDWFFYGAPLAFLFYGGPFCDPADAHVAAAHAMLAAESLGLATCMLGLPVYFIKYSGELRKKYGLPKNIQNGVGLIAGYPAVQKRRALRRRLGYVTYFPPRE